MAPAPAATRAGGNAIGSVDVRCVDGAFALSAAGLTLLASHGLGLIVPSVMIGGSVLGTPMINAGTVLPLGVALFLANAVVVGLGIALMLVARRPVGPDWRALVLALATLALVLTPVSMLLSLATTVGAAVIGDLTAAILLVIAVEKLMPGHVRVALDERREG